MAQRTRRGPQRPRVWGRTVQEPISLAAGFRISAPLASNLVSETLEEASFIRTVGSLWILGAATDPCYYGIVVADEDIFPTTFVLTETDIDWVVRHLVLPSVAGGFQSNSSRIPIDIRSGRKLRERDREPYFLVLNNAGALSVTVAWSLNTLILKT